MSKHERYWMTTPVHPEKVADWFLSLHHYWFDESLGPNMFTGMREEARQYLYIWVETGEFAPDKTTLEIYVRMKFEEWLESSWVSKSPVAAHSALVEAAKYIPEQVDLTLPRFKTADDSDTVSIEVTIGWLREVRDALALAESTDESSVADNPIIVE